MSIRGSVVLECDSKGCHAEEVIEVDSDHFLPSQGGLKSIIAVSGWYMDENDRGLLTCPQCVESAREQVEKDAEIRACGGYEAWKSL